jgi:hypothetical protein
MTSILRHEGPHAEAQFQRHRACEVEYGSCLAASRVTASASLPIFHRGPAELDACSNRPAPGLRWSPPGPVLN